MVFIFQGILNRATRDGCEGRKMDGKREIPFSAVFIKIIVLSLGVTTYIYLHLQLATADYHCFSVLKNSVVHVRGERIDYQKDAALDGCTSLVGGFPCKNMYTRRSMWLQLLR